MAVIGSLERARVLLIGLVCACVHPRTEPSTIELGHAAATRLDSEFTLLSWNTHKRTTARFERELERFADGVDLLLLQEAIEAEPTWAWRADALDWTLVVAFEYRRAALATGVATGTSVAPLREQASLSPTPEPFTSTRKSALASWIALPGGAELLLVNLHGVNFRPANALASQLAALDPVLEGHRGPIVVAGDFNTWSAARRGVVEDFAARHGLASAFGDAGPRLDDVLVRGLIVRDAQVLRSRSSDHDALRVELALP